jgi:hypothetical protein
MVKGENDWFPHNSQKGIKNERQKERKERVG